MNNFKFIVKNLQGQVVFRSSSIYDRADIALRQGDRYLRENQKRNKLYPIGCQTDVVPYTPSLK